MKIGIINESTVVPVAEFGYMVSACALQLKQHTAPAWGLKSPSVTAYKTLASVPSDRYVMAILDDADQAGALGYHDETSDGRPYGKVFAKTVLDNHGTLLTGSLAVSVTLSHELCEMLGDPNVQLWADNGGDQEVAYELCDPVESDCYDLNGVSVSNFVLPTYFDPQNSTGPWDHMGTLHAPQSMSSGGYLIVRSAGNPGQKFNREIEGAQDYPEWRQTTKLYPAARTFKRIK